MLEFEQALWSKGVERVAGVDEVGRGPLAGPVVAAAVILPRGTSLSGVRDSKRLSPAARLACYDDIVFNALSIGVGVVSHHEIDRTDILRATFRAMRLALADLDFQPEWVLVDGHAIPKLTMPQYGIVRGDSRSLSVAAASIVAKITRDAVMERLDEQYPVYGFARHKGYTTRAHLDALKRHGPCEIHRHSFRPVKEAALLAGGRYVQRG
jgi:ribonuclease HII